MGKNASFIAFYTFHILGIIFLPLLKKSLVKSTSMYLLCIYYIVLAEHTFFLWKRILKQNQSQSYIVANQSEF